MSGHGGVTAARLGFVPMAIVSLALVGQGCGKDDEPVPQFTRVPEFTLTAHTGEPITAAGLAGSVWVANFVFTSCPDVCPLLTKKMYDLRMGLVRKGLPVKFVSFSVDPKTDTPAVLAAYADKHHSRFDDWYFVTGQIDQVKQVIARGFHQRMERDPDEPENVFHGSHFVLIDQTGMIRGFYRSEHEGLLQLASDAARLIEERP